jgi:RHS repeat-associated protein
MDADGKPSYRYFDPDGRVTMTVDADGRPSYSYFDADGHLTETIDADGKASYGYFDPDGRVTMTVDANGKPSYTYYDANGQVTETIDGDGKPSFEYLDPNGNVTETVDANGKPSYRYFDPDGRVTMTVDADGRPSYRYFDANGNVTETIDADGKPSYSYFDADGRVTMAVDADGKTSYTYYDANGQVTETVDANGKPSFDYFDPNGNVTETVDANGKPSFSYFDADGRVTETVDADGHASYTLYDGDGRATETIDANGSKTFNYYDPNGNLTEVIDPDGNETDFAYDAGGRKVSMTDPLHHTVTYAYDADGRLTSTTDRDGRRRDFSYDADGRLLTELWYAADGTTVVDTLSYTYDANGNQLTASNRNDTYTFTYDADGRMLTEAEPFGVSLSFSYDADGNRTSVQDSFVGTTTSAYDANGQLTSMQFADAGGNALRADLTYDSDGHRSTVTRYADLAGMQVVGTSSYTYDADGHLVGLQHSDAAGNNLLNYSYTYDANGWLTSQTLNGTTTSYSYDATGQLTSAGSNAYSFDATGNRTLTGYQTGPGNQLLSDGTWHYSYDNEGNLVRKIDPSTGVIWTYSYDNVNRLVSTVLSWNTDPSQGVVPAGTGPVQLEVDYPYDVFGNRIERQVIDHQGSSQNDDMRFAYDGQNAWADLDGSGQLQDRHLYFAGVDQLAARLAGDGTVAWYLTDRQGSVVGLTDRGGSLVDQYQYDGFGGIISESDPSWGDRYTYTGREYDAATGLYYNRARYYDAATGRFLSQDPLGFDAGDNNWYRYVGNDPLNATDPTGKEAEPHTVSPQEWDLRRYWYFRWSAQADRLLEQRQRNWFQVFVLGAQPDGPASAWESVLRLRASRAMDVNHWQVDEQGRLTPLGTLTTELPPRLLALEEQLRAEQRQLAVSGQGKGARADEVAMRLASLAILHAGVKETVLAEQTMRDIAAKETAEQQRAAAGANLLKQFQQYPDLEKALLDEMQAWIDAQRSQFEGLIKDRSPAERATLKQQVPWFYGDVRNPDDPRFKYFAPRVYPGPGGAPDFVFAPTAALRTLQLNQSLAVGLVHEKHDATGSQYYRTRPYQLPVTPEEAQAWYAVYQDQKPTSTMPTRTVPEAGLVADTMPLMLLASAGTAGMLALGEGMSVLGATGAAIDDIQFNVAFSVASAYLDKQVGEGAGDAFGVAVILASLATRRAIQNPRLRAAFKKFWEEGGAGAERGLARGLEEAGGASSSASKLSNAETRQFRDNMDAILGDPEAAPGRSGSSRERPRSNDDPRVKPEYRSVPGEPVQYDFQPGDHAALQAELAAYKAGEEGASEALGLAATDRYMQQRMGAREVYRQQTKNGNFDLDRVYQLGDTYYVGEAKAPDAKPTGRKVKGDMNPDTNEPWWTMEGSRQYLGDTLRKMQASGNRKSMEIADSLDAALDAQKVKYFEVKARARSNGTDFYFKVTEFDLYTKP